MSVALALGGGAALGWAHIGVLRALEAAGVRVAAVAGTSIGALVAVAYAAGELDALEELARSATPRAVVAFLDPHFRRGAFLGGRAIARRLQLHLGERRLEELGVPAATVAADLVSGRVVVIASGGAVEAVRASIAIPGIFAPMATGGMLLVDGGALVPVPVAAARALSARPVLAINLQADYPARAAALGLTVDGPTPTAIRTTRAGLGLVLSQLARLSLAADPADLVLEPAVGRIDVRSFTRAVELIAIGSATVEAALPAIRALTEQPDRPLPIR